MRGQRLRTEPNLNKMTDFNPETVEFVEHYFESKQYRPSGYSPPLVGMCSTEMEQRGLILSDEGLDKNLAIISMWEAADSIQV